MQRSRFQFSLRTLLGAITGIALLFGLYSVFLWDNLRDSRHKFECAGHLRQIALAMHAYHEAQGSLPPAYVSDTDGKPMHSWRVLLLPYLGEQALHQQYDFSEPWDGPNNRRLAGKMPQVYACPADGNALGKGMTSYVVVCGKETVFNGDVPMSLSTLAQQDGTWGTVLAVEFADSEISWMEPRDLDFNRMSFSVNARSGAPGIRSHHRLGA